MYIFNPLYKLRYDVNRIVLIDDYRFGAEDFKSFVHPVYAWIINLFDGKTEFQEIILKISRTLQINNMQAKQILTPLMDNKEEIHIRYDGVISVMPEKLIIKAEGHTRESMDDSFFTKIEEVNHRDLRLFKPMNLLLCPTLKCYTDCIYCYADRKCPHKELDAEEWVKLIEQARKEDVERIDVTGGEFFMKKGWRQIAKALVENNYKPEISTKIPLDTDTLDDIKKIGLGCVQYSLDTMNTEMAVNTLRVPTFYVEKLIDSIRYADSIGLQVILKPTLCKYTCNTENVKSVLDFAATLHNVKRIVVTAIGYSCFKPRENYPAIRPTFQQIEEMRNFIRECQNEYPFPIGDDTFAYRPSDMRNAEGFKDRAICTANIDGFVLLPDGTATLCEELYWHPQFVIGNFKDMTIPQIWNSQEATRLANLGKEDFPEDSACSKCKVIDECRTNKGVCWKLVIAAYGKDKEMYPDPRCPQAPEAGDDWIIP